MKPRLLDLFCGAGGSAVGYHRAGFDVIGVDNRPQPHYPFRFVQADALAVLEDLDYTSHPPYDAIHASPPCQAYTTMNNRHGSDSPPLIAETRELLEQMGLPYVIENVMGAKRELRSPVMVCGRSVGLTLHRHRLFESNVPLMTAGCTRPDDRDAAVYGKHDQRRIWTRADGSELRAATLSEASTAMRVDWMTWDEIREAIPPAFTELIGYQLLQHLNARVVA